MMSLIKNIFSYKVSVNETILMKYWNFNEHIKIPQITKFWAYTFKNGRVTGYWKIPIMSSYWRHRSFEFEII